ncbi:MAG TPA: ChbG/HpnK family deacetylase [Solirubrobacterales bacterium]|nr:ChbG/HpnK family deacetylase [Solirubrobacterales bacterium]
MAERFLIVNADDLGLSAAVNEGVFEAHAQGVVTSASLMVLRPDAAAAGEEFHKHPRLAVGLHLAAAEDCLSQLERFRELVGRDPTHLDSHKHVHESDPGLGAEAERLAAELRVPLRNRGVRYERSFYGRDKDGSSAPEAISVEHLAALIRELPPGWTEIGCHPAAGPVPTSSYDAERQVELRTLCDPSIREALNVTNVKLCSFAQVIRPQRRTFGT